MFRKLLFSVLGALVVAGGVLLSSAVPGDTAPVTMSPVPQVQVHGDLIQVKACGQWNNWCGNGPGGNCGWWNNWCNGGNGNWGGGGGGGGASGCITLGGVRFCVGGGGSKCHWHNGVKYCNGGGGNGGGGGSCIHVNGHKYCTYKHYDCIWVNGKKYCRYN